MEFSTQTTKPIKEETVKKVMSLLERNDFVLKKSRDLYKKDLFEIQGFLLDHLETEMSERKSKSFLLKVVFDLIDCFE